MKKYILLGLTILLILPNLVFAAWWNPVSWFTFFFDQVTGVQTVETPMSVVNLHAIQSATTTSHIKIASSTNNKSLEITSTTTKKKTIVKPAPTVVASPSKNQVQQTVGISTPFQATTTVITPSTTTECNGKTYALVCPTGQHFFCPTNGSVGQCLGADAQYCNGQGWNACPTGENFSCSSNGGVCSLPPAIYQPTQPQNTPTLPVVQPIVSTAPSGPTPAQQTATCQQQYNTSLLTLNSVDIRTSLQTRIANDQQQLNQMGNNGVAMSGQAGLVQQDLSGAQGELITATAAYNLALSGIQNTLQTCLSNITQ